jgi:hypothetical protein
MERYGKQCGRCVEWYLDSLVSTTSKQSSSVAGVCAVHGHDIHQSFAIALALAIGSFSIKQPAKNVAIPSKSSKVDTFDTSTSS